MGASNKWVPCAAGCKEQYHNFSWTSPTLGSQPAIQCSSNWSPISQFTYKHSQPPPYLNPKFFKQCHGPWMPLELLLVWLISERKNNLTYSILIIKMIHTKWKDLTHCFWSNEKINITSIWVGWIFYISWCPHQSLLLGSSLCQCLPSWARELLSKYLICNSCLSSCCLHNQPLEGPLNDSVLASFTLWKLPFLWAQGLDGLLFFSSSASTTASTLLM